MHFLKPGLTDKSSIYTHCAQLPVALNHRALSIFALNLSALSVLRPKFRKPYPPKSMVPIFLLSSVMELIFPTFFFSIFAFVSSNVLFDYLTSLGNWRDTSSSRNWN